MSADGYGPAQRQSARIIPGELARIVTDRCAGTLDPRPIERP
jgi:hypothetical protein